MGICCRKPIPVPTTKSPTLSRRGYTTAHCFKARRVRLAVTSVSGVLSVCFATAAAAQQLGPFSSRPPTIDGKAPDERFADIVEQFLGELGVAIRTYDTISLAALLTDDAIPRDERDIAQRAGCLSPTVVLSSLSRARNVNGGSGLFLEIADRQLKDQGRAAEVSAALVASDIGRLRYAPIRVSVVIGDERLRVQQASGLLAGLCGMLRSGS